MGGREIETCVREREGLATKILVWEAEKMRDQLANEILKESRGDFAGRRGMYKKNCISTNSSF